MASKSLGTLTLDLVARVGGFTGPLDKASRESQKRMAEIKKSAEQIGVGIGAGVAAGVAALAALTISSVKAGNEISRFAQVSGTSTTEFQKYAAGAKAVGIEQDKLADIFKDTSDKVGDFLSTGGGELQNFFTSIAPKVGVTADQFRNLSGPQALQLYVSSLEKAKISQSEMTFYMEAIANDATLLTPLLRNNGEGFKVLGESAAAAGAIMDEKTIKSTQELSAALLLADQATSGLKNQLTAEMLPVLSDLANVLLDVSVDGTAAAGMASVLGETLRTTAQVAVGVVASIDLIGSSLGGLGVKFANFKVPNWAKALIDPMAGLQGMVDDMKAEAGVAGQTAGDIVNEDLEAKIFKYAGIIEALGKAGSSGETNTKVKELAELLAKLRNEGNTPGTFKALTKGQQDAAKSAEAAAKKLQGTFDTTEEGYARQIELINTTTDAQNNATEAAKLAFELTSGKLVGINAEQQKRLEGLAVELDRLKKIRQANEDAKKLSAFTNTESNKNQSIQGGFDQDLAGIGSGEKLRERMRADIGIRQQYAQDLADLNEQFNTGQITEDLYRSENQVIEESLAKRLVMQQDYYNQVDEAQSNWVNGASEAWANYLDEAADVAGQTESLFSNAFSGLEDSLVDFVKTGKMSLTSLIDGIATDLIRMSVKIGVEALAQQLMGSAIQAAASAGYIAEISGQASAQVAMAALNAFASTAAIPVVGPGLAPAAAAAATAGATPFAAAAVAGATSSLAGMAHSGMDSIPKEGTWLLDGGERVVTPEQNKDLTRFLSNADVQPSGSSGAAPQIHITINKDGSDGAAEATAGYEQLAQQHLQLLQQQMVGIAQNEIVQAQRQNGALDPNGRRR